MGRVPDDGEWLTMNYSNRDEGICEEMV